MQNSDTQADLLIIGAGPAGLTAAQYGARANLRTLVLNDISGIFHGFKAAEGIVKTSNGLGQAALGIGVLFIAEM
jgi:thioredoxin reductase